MPRSVLVAERPGKRTDPHKIQREQKAIMQDVVKRTTRKESPLDKLAGKIRQNRENALRRRIGGPINRRGSVVVGFRKRREEA